MWWLGSRGTQKLQPARLVAVLDMAGKHTTRTSICSSKNSSMNTMTVTLCPFGVHSNTYEQNFFCFCIRRVHLRQHCNATKANVWNMHTPYTSISWKSAKGKWRWILSGTLFVTYGCNKLMSHARAQSDSSSHLVSIVVNGTALYCCSGTISWKNSFVAAHTRVNAMVQLNKTGTAFPPLLR